MYHDSLGGLPPGWIAQNPSTNRPCWLGRTGWGWAARIPPFLEQANVVDNLIDYRLPLLDGHHDQARRTVIPTYICPSDTGDSIFVLEAGPTPLPNYPAGYVPKQVSKTDYVGVFGTIRMLNAGCPMGDCVGNGTMVLQRSFKLRDILDGLSNTFIIGERNSEFSPSTWLGVFAGTAHAPGRIVAVAETPPNSSVNPGLAFSSYHPAGTNFLSADGSVKMISESIDMQTLHSLCTRAGGDVIGEYSA